jgi:hypothetical protein
MERVGEILLNETYRLSPKQILSLAPSTIPLPGYIKAYIECITGGIEVSETKYADGTKDVELNPTLRRPGIGTGDNIESALANFSRTLAEIPQPPKGKGVVSLSVAEGLGKGIMGGNCIRWVSKGRGNCLDWAVATSLTWNAEFREKFPNLTAFIVPFGGKMGAKYDHFGVAIIDTEKNVAVAYILYGGVLIKAEDYETTQKRLENQAEILGDIINIIKQVESGPFTLTEEQKNLMSELVRTGTPTKEEETLIQKAAAGSLTQEEVRRVLRVLETQRRATRVQSAYLWKIRNGVNRLVREKSEKMAKTQLTIPINDKTIDSLGPMSSLFRPRDPEVKIGQYFMGLAWAQNGNLNLTVEVGREEAQEATPAEMLNRPLAGESNPITLAQLVVEAAGIHDDFFSARREEIPKTDNLQFIASITVRNKKGWWKLEVYKLEGTPNRLFLKLEEGQAWGQRTSTVSGSLIYPLL